MTHDVFQAIAAPARRAILTTVAARSMTVNTLADGLDMSRQALFKHLKVLTQCGLIELRQQGRERYCEARLQRLGEVTIWIEECRQIVEQQLDSLENYLQTIQSKQAIQSKNDKHEQRRKPQRKRRS